jgi:hypothetical protein
MGNALGGFFLPGYGLTTAGLAEAMGLLRQTINEIRQSKSATQREPVYVLPAADKTQLSIFH